MNKKIYIGTNNCIIKINPKQDSPAGYKKTLIQAYQARQDACKALRTMRENRYTLPSDCFMTAHALR